MNFVTKDFNVTTTETYEYEMSAELAKNIFAKHKKKYKNIAAAEPQKLLYQFVNDEFDLKGICVGVKVR